MKASEIAGRRPSLVVRLEPGDFSDRWRNRPTVGIAVGLRFVSDAQEGQAREDAARFAANRYAEIGDSSAALAEYNDELMARLVGAALCDPNDLAKDPDDLPFPEDMARSALRSSTIERLFRALERARVEFGAAIPIATDDDVERLAALLHAGALRLVPEHRASRARRFLAAALADLID